MTTGDDPDEGSRGGTIAALVFTLVLIAFGLWIAQAIIGMVKQQNCAMSGRRDCLVLPDN